MSDSKGKYYRVRATVELEVEFMDTGRGQDLYNQAEFALHSAIEADGTLEIDIPSDGIREVLAPADRKLECASCRTVQAEDERVKVPQGENSWSLVCKECKHTSFYTLLELGDVDE